jgi:hypothetical protein
MRKCKRLCSGKERREEIAASPNGE